MTAVTTLRRRRGSEWRLWRTTNSLFQITVQGIRGAQYRDKESLLGHSVVGQTWESFIIETLITAAPDGTEAHYYRTSNGTEVDLILTLPGGANWAIEVKRSSAPKPERGFYSACADLAPTKRFLVYPGAERFPLDEFTDAIGVVDLANELQSAK